MDNRLIFRYLGIIVIRSGGTQEDRHAVDWKWLYKRVARVGRKIHLLVKVRRDVEGPRTWRCWLQIAKKIFAFEIVLKPYRKPPQVGRKKILRSARQLSLRNSAKSPRNFGRRGTLVAWSGLPVKRDRVAVNRPKRLFTKNTGLC